MTQTIYVVSASDKTKVWVDKVEHNYFNAVNHQEVLESKGFIANVHEEEVELPCELL